MKFYPCIFFFFYFNWFSKMPTWAWLEKANKADLCVVSIICKGLNFNGCVALFCNTIPFRWGPQCHFLQSPPLYVCRHHLTESGPCSFSVFEIDESWLSKIRHIIPYHSLYHCSEGGYTVLPLCLCVPVHNKFSSQFPKQLLIAEAWNF
jgi:hypothetical protein